MSYGNDSGGCTAYCGERASLCRPDRSFSVRTTFFDWDIVISDEREKLLDTGGGLLKARELFCPGESVLIHNVDIFSDIDIPALLRFHRQIREMQPWLPGPAGKAED